jgi:hypothetical protein
MTSLRSLPLMMMLGMLSCEVRSAAVRATLFIPGMLAMFSKVGAMRLGDCPGPLSTRWHSAHATRAILNPWLGFPISCASRLPTVNVELASTRLTADPRRCGDLKMLTPTTAPWFVGPLFQGRNIHCDVICRRPAQWQIRHLRMRVQEKVG